MSKIVLIAEDEELVRWNAVEEFEESGWIVLQAASGDEALPIIRSEQPIDLLFTDIRMPGATDGWALAEQARARRPTLAVIYASGFNADQPRQVEGSVYLPKPYFPQTLRGALRQLGLE